MTRQIVKNKKNHAIYKEIKKIRKEIRLSDKSLERLYKLIIFLFYGRGNKITGKIISSRWDKFEKWNKTLIRKLNQTDIFKLRRVQK